LRPGWQATIDDAAIIEYAVAHHIKYIIVVTQQHVRAGLAELAQAIFIRYAPRIGWPELRLLLDENLQQAGGDARIVPCIPDGQVELVLPVNDCLACLVQAAGIWSVGSCQAASWTIRRFHNPGKQQFSCQVLVRFPGVQVIWQGRESCPCWLVI